MCMTPSIRPSTPVLLHPSSFMIHSIKTESLHELIPRALHVCRYVYIYINTHAQHSYIPYQIMFDKYIWIHIFHSVNQSTNQCVRIYFMASGSVRLFVHEQQQIRKDRETTKESQLVIHHNSSVTQITSQSPTISQLWMDRNRKNLDEPILSERWDTCGWYISFIQEIRPKLEYRADIHEERYVFVQNDVHTKDM